MSRRFDILSYSCVYYYAVSHINEASLVAKHCKSFLLQQLQFWQTLLISHSYFKQIASLKPCLLNVYPIFFSRIVESHHDDSFSCAVSKYRISVYAISIFNCKFFCFSSFSLSILIFLFLPSFQLPCTERYLYCDQLSDVLAVVMNICEQKLRNPHSSYCEQLFTNYYW